jgi:hypothetical protein
MFFLKSTKKAFKPLQDFLAEWSNDPEDTEETELIRGKGNP